MIAIDLALIASEAHRTNAFISVHQIAAFAAVLARFGRALVDINVAIFAGVTRGTAAMVIIHQVNAKRAMLALTNAIVDILRAVLASEAAPASASVK